MEVKKNMGVNRSAKGRRHVREAMKIYECMGWRCWKPGVSAIFVGGKIICHSQDIFGCYDFVCTKDGMELNFVQVTTIQRVDEQGLLGGVLSDVAKRRDKIDKYGVRDDNSMSVVMGKKARKGWRIWMKKGKGEWVEYEYERFIRYLESGIDGIRNI